MTSKARVLNAFDRIKPDRVPVNYMSNPGIHAKVAKALGVRKYEKVRQAFNVDFRGINAPFKGTPHFKELPGRKVDPVYGFYTKWIGNKFGGYEDFCDFPLMDADEATIRNFHVPSPDDFDYSEVYDYCKSKKEYAMGVGDPGIGTVINTTGFVMNMENALVNLITEDAATIDYIRRRTDMELGKMERLIGAAKGHVDFLWLGEDLGTQDKPLISRDLYLKVLAPIHQKFIDLAKANKLRVMIHTCGSSSWIYDDLIRMGVDAVDTLQPEALNMSPKYLADRFGGRLSFHGCISTAGPLSYGTLDELEKQVRDTMEVMKPTYGYMLSPTHSIQDNTPVWNVIALYKFAEKYGRY
ncbi:MAG: hypothetical protein FWE62_00740 [Firmicutes bacterium]|nr:hypothetical protein [Bacillota bacterium]